MCSSGVSNASDRLKPALQRGGLLDSFGASEHHQVTGDSDGAEETEVAKRGQVVPPVNGVLLVEREIIADHVCHGGVSALIRNRLDFVGGSLGISDLPTAKWAENQRVICSKENVAHVLQVCGEKATDFGGHRQPKSVEQENSRTGDQ